MCFARRLTYGRVCFERSLRAIAKTSLDDVSAGTLLEIDNLSVEFATERGALRAVAGVSLSVGASNALGIVGESGSGKTVLSRAVLKLLPSNVRVSGAVRFDGRELFRLSREALRQLRGGEIAVVFQDR
jgi:ABC-type glutathione transport system ATPase component